MEQEILSTVRTLRQPGQVTEVRILSPTGGVASGYFTDPEKIVAAVKPRSGKANVYFTLNPVHPEAPERLQRGIDNRLHDRVHKTTGDADIASRRLILVDFDPVRKANTASTDAEHHLALARARSCATWLIEFGFPKGSIILCDSGNGAHVLIRIDLANTAASKDLVNRCLAAIALGFTDDAVVVDLAVGNAARITKFYGTRSVKGSNTADRPHRYSRILSCPDSPEIAPHALLQELAARVPEEPKLGSKGKPEKGTSLDVERWLSEHGIGYRGPTLWKSGAQKFVLPVCPFNPEHDNKSAVIIQFESGALVFKCHHNGCAGKDWPALRDLYEPGRQERRDGKADEELRKKLDDLVAKAKASQDPGVPFKAIELLVRLPLADQATYRSKFKAALGKNLNMNHFDSALSEAKKKDISDPESDTERIANSITADHHFAQDEGEQLYYYDDGRYVPRGKRLIKRLVKAKMKTLGLKWTTHASKEVMRFISDDAPLLKDSPEGELNCLNGVVDLKAGVIRAHSPDDLTTFPLPVLYDQSATCPEFDRFISTILPDEDPGIIHEMAADALTTDRDDQKAILLEGSGGNGKSILLSALSAFAGPDNVSHYSLHDLENNRFATSGLLGKRFNICSDLPSTHLKTSSVFKQITGHDVIHGEFKHGASFSFQPQVRLILSANTPPQAKDATLAFYQRWVVIKFKREFRGTRTERPGRQLLAELTTEAELSGLLNLALAALPNLLKNGFTISAGMREAADEFRRTTDPLALWLDANTVAGREAWVTKANLLRAYNLSCDKSDRSLMNATAFTPAVERLRPQARGVQKTVGDKTGVRVWVGIGLIATDEHTKAPDSMESPQSEAATRGTRGQEHCKRSETTPWVGGRGG